MDDLKDIIKNIPNLPGVYLMKDKEKNIIYVGKAISLKKRVKQYFNKSNKTQRIINMVKLINDIEYIVVNNEKEALILENNLIKANMPKFNVLLKDDKTYPYIKITIKDKYPLIYITRKLIDDGSKYYGPYSNVSACRDVMKLIYKIFKIKRCKQDFNKIPKEKRRGPCLYYHINKCMGPCINDVESYEYKQVINQVCLFLEGRYYDIQDMLKVQIKDCIKNLDFEKAQSIKNILDSINEVLDKQNISNISESDADIFGVIKNKEIFYLQIFKIRGKKIVDRDSFTIESEKKETLENLMDSIILQYYNNREIPNNIYIKNEFENIENVKNILSEKKGKNVNIKVTKKGEKYRLVQMVENNINILLSERTNNLEKLQNILNINYELTSIESYDISNLKNEYIVGTMIRVDNGKLNKKMYRKFKIKSQLTQNDPECIYEVLKRRLNHKEEWELPDAIFVDGGKTQVNKVVKALREDNLDIDVYGMFKDSRHKTKGLIDSNGKEILIEDKSVLNFLAFIQEEVHRFTIKYHRELRDRVIKK